jgi:hypothetical protein
MARAETLHRSSSEPRCLVKPDPHTLVIPLSFLPILRGRRLPGTRGGPVFSRESFRSGSGDSSLLSDRCIRFTRSPSTPRVEEIHLTLGVPGLFSHSCPQVGDPRPR